MTVPPTKVRVRYSEVDRMGFLYHVVYYEYFEWARSDWIRHVYKPYREIEDDGFAIVVIEANLKYLSPAHYDDVLEVSCKLEDYGRSRVIFDYKICRQGEIDPICTGRTAHCFIDKSGKPVKMPEGLRERLEKFR